MKKLFSSAFFVLLSFFIVLTGRVEYVFANGNVFGDAVFGLRLGMTQAEVVDAVDKISGVVEKNEKRRKSNAEQLRNVYLLLSDDSFLTIGFSNVDNQNVVGEISIVYKGKSFADDLVSSYETKYGKPDEHKSIEGVEAWGWGGKIEFQGSITPYPGKNVCVLIEKTGHQKISITWVKFL